MNNSIRYGKFKKILYSIVGGVFIVFGLSSFEHSAVAAMFAFAAGFIMFPAIRIKVPSVLARIATPILMFGWIVVLAPSLPDSPRTTVPNNVVSEQTTTASRVDIQQIKPPEPLQKQYVSTNFKDFDKIFGIKSDYTEIQKDELFKKDYEGRLVKWTGTVTEISQGTFSGFTIQIKHLSTTFVSDVILHVKDSEIAKAKGFKKGQKISYEGTLNSYGELLPTSVDDAIILNQ